MRTRIYNARILTMEEKRPVFKGDSSGYPKRLMNWDWNVT